MPRNSKLMRTGNAGPRQRQASKRRRAQARKANVWRPTSELLEERALLAADLLTTGLDVAGDSDNHALQHYHIEFESREDGSRIATSNGAVIIAEPVPNQEQFYSANTLVESPTLAPLAPLSETFLLHSNPGASKTIYLDFDGHTTSGTEWNLRFTGGQDVVSPAFSLDSNYSQFSDSELTRIQGIWERVAEDFLPFDVDVTTEDPGDAALWNTFSADNEYGTRVVVSDYSSWFDVAGGVAFLNSFGESHYMPAFVFTNYLGGGEEKATAEAASHEAGHTLGLEHDGTNSAEYYGGHGNGATGWAPIMGVGYNKEVTQWSKGEYNNATQFEDDLAIITSRNGFGYRADQAGNTQQTAATLGITDGTSVFQEGIIETTADLDYFVFEAGAGSLSLNLDPFYRSPNLDILARLYDSSGTVLATSNPSSALNATLTTTVTGGTYYVSVAGVGFGTPSTGYSDYGSLGYYSITGTVEPLGPDEAAPTAALASLTTGGTTTTVTLNDRGYLDVTFADTGGSGLDTSSITDSAAEFTLSGTAAQNVVVGGAAQLVSGTTYRYTFTGDFTAGTVGVDFLAGTWQDLADTPNVNAAESESFTVLAEPAAEFILDNSDPTGVTIAGDWQVFTPASGAYGPTQLSDRLEGKGTKSVTYTPEIDAAGEFHVYLTWSSNSVRATNVPVDIIHAGGTTTVFVNQRQNGGQFNYLGSFNFAAGTTGSVRIRTDGTEDGYVVADAVRLVRDVPDADPPTADLALPVNGETIVAMTLNDAGYIHVTYSDGALGDGTDGASITDAGAEFELSGTAAAGVTVSGAGELVSGTTYRYTFTGDFTAGTVGVDFLAGTWQDLADTPNVNAAESESFTVLAEPAAEFILDNSDPTGVTIAGDWQVFTPASGAYGPTQLSDRLEGKGTKSVTYTPEIDAAGEFHVYLTWSSNSVRATNVPVDIIHAGGTTTVFVNQRQNGGQFNYLGSFNFAAGTTGSVRIRTDGTEDGYVVADAVRFERKLPDLSPPTASLSTPESGGTIVRVTLNNVGYLYVTYDDELPGDGLNTASIEDPEPEFELVGLAAQGVTVDGAGELVSGTTYRYRFDGSFTSGAVEVDFLAGAWQDNADTPNLNLAETETFTILAQPLDEIILDNDAAEGVTTVGSWATFTPVADHYGPNQLHDEQSGKGTKSVTYTPEIDASGDYHVYLYWSSNSLRSTAVPVDIMHAGGTTTVFVNQQQGGGQFNHIGTFHFDYQGGGFVRIRTDGTDGKFVIADAVKFDRIQGGVIPPVAELTLPRDGATVVASELNALSYLDVTFDSNGGAALDANSILDSDAEFVLSGSVAAGVTVNGAPTWVSGNTYRYSFTGTFGLGEVEVDFLARTWKNVEDVQSEAETESFALTLAPAPAITMDNSSSSGVTTTGAWDPETVAGNFGSNQLHDNNTGKGTKAVTFTPVIDAAGIYDVYLRWTSAADQATNVPVDIVHAGGLTTVAVDQTQNGSQFNLLGRFAFDLGTDGSITIRNEGTNGYVIADAVRLVRVATQTLTLSITDDYIPENGGVTTATLSRAGGTSGDLVVTLTNGDSSEASVPATVTIPAGQSSVTFQISGVDDAVADGSQTFSITASASGYTTSQDLLTVTDGEAFQIDLRFTDSGLSASQKTILQQAAARWAELVVGDLPDELSYDGLLVDDLLVDVSVGTVDGAGSHSAQSGITELRGSSLLPKRAYLQLDTADLAALESGGTLDEVALRELGHTLGFGTLWSTFGLITGEGGSDPRYHGTQALAEYNAALGLSASSVPVENTGGNGVADIHWRESTFDGELMSGVLDANNPISRITVAALADLGYTVNLSAADNYTPPAAAATATAPLAESAAAPLAAPADTSQPQTQILLPPQSQAEVDVAPAASPADSATEPPRMRQYHDLLFAALEEAKQELAAFYRSGAEGDIDALIAELAEDLDARMEDAKELVFGRDWS